MTSTSGICLEVNQKFEMELLYQQLSITKKKSW